MSAFLLRRGRGSTRRRAHLAKYDAWGRISGAWCGRTGFDLNSNVPWGQPICKDCKRKGNFR